MGSFGWGLALGFVLVVISVASFVILQSFSEEALRITVQETRGRGFKGDVLSVPFVIGTKPGIALDRVELVSVPEGLDVEILGEGTTRTIEVRSKFAGVYMGIRVRVGVLDPIRILARKEVHEVPYSFEFLPRCLLARADTMKVTAAMLGDYPAGRGGSGQEFYTAELYTTASSSKDIMWRRLAKAPDEELLVRVGEANIPERLSVCFVENPESANRRSPTWMDLVSEAVARVGLPVVNLGIAFRLVRVVGKETTMAEARGPRSLADLVVGLWYDGALEKADSGPGEADVILIPYGSLKDPASLHLVLEKPSIVLTWGERRETPGSSVVFFSGNENLDGLVARVLSR